MKRFIIYTITLVVSILVAIPQEAGGATREKSDYALAQEAYESMNLEAIKEICQHPGKLGNLIVYLDGVPTSAWKDGVVLVVIEAAWPGDRVEGRPAPPGSPAPFRYFQLAVDLLSPVLPDENLKMNDRETYAKLSTLNSRKRLADKFRKATRKQDPGNGQNGTGQVESPQGENLKSPQAETSNASSSPGPNPVADKPNMPPVANKTWIWILAALFVVGLGLILKLRRTK